VSQQTSTFAYTSQSHGTREQGAAQAQDERSVYSYHEFWAVQGGEASSWLALATTASNDRWRPPPLTTTAPQVILVVVKSGFLELRDAVPTTTLLCKALRFGPNAALGCLVVCQARPLGSRFAMWRKMLATADVEVCNCITSWMS